VPRENGRGRGCGPGRGNVARPRLHAHRRPRHVRRNDSWYSSLPSPRIFGVCTAPL